MKPAYDNWPDESFMELLRNGAHLDGIGTEEQRRLALEISAQYPFAAFAAPTTKE